MRLSFILSICFLSMNIFAADYQVKENTMSLAGVWSVQLDPDDEGVAQQWYNKELSGSAKLPGTLDENGFGKVSTAEPELKRENLLILTRKYDYRGPAWYQKTIDIPQSWQNKKIFLNLERVMWQSQVWLDDKYLGKGESLVASHIYTLPDDIQPGRHKLTIRIDNRKLYNVGKMAHAYSDQTQIIWNGVIGDISLSAHDLLWIEDIQIYPDVERKKAVLRITVNNQAGADKCKIKLSAKSTECGNFHKVSSLEKQYDIKAGENILSIEYDMGENVKLWSEFSPVLYNLTAEVETDNARDIKTQRFGMRRFRANAARLELNGKPIFLRGTLECCIFPLTGHPPMDRQGWEKVFTAAKSYGLNHLRFHSWCPPEEAFAVADEMGFYLQVELPVWVDDIGKDKPRDEFLEAEGYRILKAYGNHPSFCLMSMGNEMVGDYDFLHKLVKEYQAADNRHLYCSTTFSFQGQHGRWPEPVDDFYISQATKKGWIRGQGFFNNQEPSTAFDFRKSLEGLEVPTISHEIGQYTVYPNMKEIEKYTGVLEPINFLSIQKDLKEKGLLDKANEWTLASGKLSVLLYKEDIELAFRTEGLSGFQLLDLHDFPGQGTALIGTLDAFWDSKGLITPKQYRRFCSPTVPLLRMDKKIFLNNETFKASAEIVHYGSDDLHNAQVAWYVSDQDGKKIFSGSFGNFDIAVGSRALPGNIEINLNSIEKPSMLNIVVYVNDTDIINDWNIWVYPTEQVEPADDVLVAEEFNSEVQQALNDGKKVVVLADAGILTQSVPGRFVPVFWSPVHFPGQPGTMGILCKPKHPALADFPTEFHSDWQWWDITTNSVCMILNDAPSEFEPIVEVVDNFTRNNRMANLFEAKVGRGRLLVCSVDLESNIAGRPASKQLKNSIFKYVNSSAFKPEQSLSMDYLKNKLFKKPSAFHKAKVVMTDSQEVGYEGDKAIDNNTDTMWHTNWSSNETDYPHEIQIALKKETLIKGFVYVPRQDKRDGGRVLKYEFYVSNDVKQWGRAAAYGVFNKDKTEKTVMFDKPLSGRYIRFVGVKGFGDDKFCSIAELKLIVD